MPHASNKNVVPIRPQPMPDITKPNPEQLRDLRARLIDGTITAFVLRHAAVDMVIDGREFSTGAGTDLNRYLTRRFASIFSVNRPFYLPADTNVMTVAAPVKEKGLHFNRSFNSSVNNINVHTTTTGELTVTTAQPAGSDAGREM